MEKTINSHHSKISELDDEVSHLPAERELESGLKGFEAEFVSLKSQMDKEAGALEKIEEAIKKSLTDLSDKKYLGIEERYKLKHIQLHAMKAANKDLDRYYQALDKALMRFHEMKMEEINKTVKEYWQETYQGQDIDTVEIKADVESSTPNRRSHNYRLVMRHKSQAELDMRGRCRCVCPKLFLSIILRLLILKHVLIAYTTPLACAKCWAFIESSAGQKVLASLVVRLALAETFCHNCGILALDEPTSNLDHSNIVGFTEALAKIVEERGRRSGFQLIIISHDDDFIQNLARLTNVPSYYRVQKDPSSQTSRITAHDVTQL